MAFPSYTAIQHHDTYHAIDPINPKLSMQGKVVIITGGGSGIGKATALAFAKAQAKAVLITDRSQSKLKDTADEVKMLGIKAEYVVADVTDKSRMQECFAKAMNLFGRVDIIIFNAGYLPDPALIQNIDIDEWWKAFEINTRRSFIVIQAFVQHCGPAATLVNMTTALAHIPYFPEFSSYGASKLATVRILQDVHQEHPELRVFSVQPGLIDTETSSKSSVPGEDTVDLPASFSVWLATTEADFLRGRTVWANWDVEELLEKSATITERDDLKIVLKGWPQGLDRAKPLHLT